jgi:6,7-dimethyl-8-ribityllumazine synthase
MGAQLEQHGSSRQVHLAADCGKSARLALVVSRFNEPISQCLVDGAQAVLAEHGTSEPRVVWVPGAFELPGMAQRLARSGKFDALICLGAVIRGDTPHFDFVSHQAAAGIMQVGLQTGVPTLFGVLTCDSLEQAEARCGIRGANRGRDLALAALEMVQLYKEGQ